MAKLRFAAALYGQQGPTVERRIDELLDLFELTRWKDDLVITVGCGDVTKVAPRIVDEIQRLAEAAR